MAYTSPNWQGCNGSECMRHLDYLDPNISKNTTLRLRAMTAWWGQLRWPVAQQCECAKSQGQSLRESSPADARAPLPSAVSLRHLGYLVQFSHCCFEFCLSGAQQFPTKFRRQFLGAGEWFSTNSLAEDLKLSSTSMGWLITTPNSSL